MHLYGTRTNASYVPTCPVSGVGTALRDTRNTRCFGESIPRVPWSSPYFGGIDIPVALEYSVVRGVGIPRYSGVVSTMNQLNPENLKSRTLSQACLKFSSIVLVNGRGRGSGIVTRDDEASLVYGGRETNGE